MSYQSESQELILGLFYKVLDFQEECIVHQKEPLEIHQSHELFFIWHSQ